MHEHYCQGVQGDYARLLDNLWTPPNELLRERLRNGPTATVLDHPWLARQLRRQVRLLERGLDDAGHAPCVLATLVARVVSREPDTQECANLHMRLRCARRVSRLLPGVALAEGHDYRTMLHEEASVDAGTRQHTHVLHLCAPLEQGGLGLVDDLGGTDLARAVLDVLMAHTAAARALVQPRDARPQPPLSHHPSLTKSYKCPLLSSSRVQRAMRRRRSFYERVDRWLDARSPLPN